MTDSIRCLTHNIDWPAPIALALDAFDAEERPFIKVNRLKDVFEAVLKYAAIIAIQNAYTAVSPRKPDLADAISEKINKPQLGHWLMFMKDAMGAFSQEQDSLFSKDLYAFCYKDVRKKPSQADHMKADGACTKLLQFRNSMAHGATLPDDDSRALLEEHLPYLEQLLDKAGFLTKLSLLYLEESLSNGEFLLRSMMGRVGQPTILSKGLPLTLSDEHVEHLLVMNPETDRFLDLHPLIVFGDCTYLATSKDGAVEKGKPCGERKVLLYNGFLSSKIGFLDYSQGHHSHFSSSHHYAEQFRKVFPETAVATRQRFEQSVRHASPDFVGRKREFELLDSFLQDSAHRALVVCGPPGIGKSELLAAWADRSSAIRHFIHEENVSSADTSTILEHLSSQLASRFKIPITRSDYRDPQKALKDFQSVLAQASVEAGSGRVIVVVDGIDEAVRVKARSGQIGEQGSIADLLPSLETLPDNVRLVMSVRPELRVGTSFRSKFGGDKVKWIDLPGISDAETRELLLQVRSIYDLEEAPEYIEEIIRRSQGYPLYVRMLIDELAENTLVFGQDETLPFGLRGYFRRLLDQIQEQERRHEKTQLILHPSRVEEPVGGDSIDLLALYAIAKEPLKPPDAAAMLALPLPEIARRLKILGSVLTEETDGAFRVFHVSFRDYLLSEDIGAEKIARVRVQLLSWCQKWSGHTSEYALRQYPLHLADSISESIRARRQRDAEKRYSELVGLLTDISFVMTKIETPSFSVYDILQNYRLASVATTIDSTLTENLYAWYEFLELNSHILARSPELLLQQALNEPLDSPVYRDSAKVPRRQPLLRWLNKPAYAGSFPLLRTMTGHTKEVLDVSITSDGRFILSAGSDGTYRLWEFETGRELRRVVPLGRSGVSDPNPFEYQSLMALRITPDGHKVILGGAVTALRCFEYRTSR